MTLKNSPLLLFVLYMGFFPAQKASAQENPSQLDVVIDSLFRELENDSFLSLIDSLIHAQEPVKSEMMVRFAYLSKISAMGRDMGIDQYGLSPSLSYFHKSGMFADITGYWNSGDSVNINYTMLMVGYMKDLGKVLGISLSYDHSFYGDEGYNLTNSINLANYFNFDFWDMGVDYSLMFGSETAHRLNFSISGYLPIRKALAFDRITFSPRFSAMLGTSNVINENYTMEQVNTYSPIVNSPIIGRGRQYLNPSDFYNSRESKAFGIMNYNFSIPVKFTIKKLSLTFKYNYNIPVYLPGESIELPSYSYYSMAAAYRFVFSK
jgi:hypothetical protein